MNSRHLLAAFAAGLLTTTALPAFAQPYFNRIASFPVDLNTPEIGADVENSSEIIAATEDGMMLVYSNALVGGIGFVDITDPADPQPGGFVMLEGSPTSVTIIGEKALVTVDTTEDFTAPTGYLAIVDLESREVELECDLGGQPDAVARNADGSLIAISMENQRDEDLNDGVIPQLPGGNVTFFDVDAGVVDCDSMRVTDLSGLAEIAGEDAEPEFTDFNGRDELVVTLQENNHIVVLAGRTGEVISHFSAGAVDLENIDATEDGRLSFTESQPGRLREPDAVKWIDDDRFVIANEGDYEGGARGFTIFHKDGTMLYESGPSMEYIAAQLGHYPEARSDAKGVEPEGMEVASFGDDTFIFVNQERASLVAVYRDTGAEPEYVQSLPSGVGPEGAVAIPSRNLFVTANETDLSPDGLADSHVMIFELGAETPAYPQIMSDLDADGRLIGWAALSGLVADLETPGRLFAVNDSFFSMMPTIYTIDATATPARIVEATPITRDGATAEALDIEGIAHDGQGGFWLASEGRTDRDIPHALLRTNRDGEIIEEIAFPDALLAHEVRFGAEGVTMTGEGDAAIVWIAIQREWGDDPAGHVKLLAYTPATGEWGAVHYPLETTAEGAWNGLSEITAHGETIYLVERDNQIGSRAVLKALYSVPLSQLEPAPLGGGLPVVTKTLVRDFMPDLEALNGYVLDKVEGFAIDAAGEGWVVTDNDGVDDASGETNFFSIGMMN
ncbi:esterase-like activity of phytase family protein [Arsenicitalea aurantiaca]|uniref:Esterase-like activity of phytase family protein n=1 Tax=Arsenicitalea aurantiaca TaxID=1783274 RepID=A0A433XMC1_9HYPH|nr:esterase-like activity of phytase family protein [Arsenicitalea aurantiaca]RUT35138.1 esterase-like activity of phytase family protein [Arsenicitalea aurantiaca]